MQIKDIIKVEQVLCWEIHQAIKSAVRDVTSYAVRPQEPDFVASLTINFSRDLFRILKALFPNNKFSITGVFCHQKPIVDIGQAKAPEIGDLLLVCIHTAVNRKKTFNSILFQAKVSEKSVLTVATGIRINPNFMNIGLILPTNVPEN